MTWKPTYLRSLIPLVAFPLFLGCNEGIMDPDDRRVDDPEVQDHRLPAGELELLILPGAANLEVGDLLELRPYWQDGEDVYDDPGKDFSWASDDPGIASVTDEGLVRGLMEGTARITVEIDGEAAEAMVTVMQA